MSAASPRPPAAPALREIQAPVRAQLERVSEELRRIVSADFPLITEVNEHLLQMRGKMFRPTLTLLASEVEETPQPRVTTMAAVVELLHLATLVHASARDADGELGFQPPDQRHHGGLSVLPGPGDAGDRR